MTTRPDVIEMSEDYIDQEVVYVAGRQNGGGSHRKVHTGTDCIGLRGANKILEKPLDSYPGEVDWCQACTGEMERSETQDLSHLKSLKAAAEAGGE